MQENNIPVKDLTYNEAFAELDSILKLMQSDKCDIDRLAAMTRRAAELITECRRRLTVAENDLNSVLVTIEQ